MILDTSTPVTSAPTTSTPNEYFGPFTKGHFGLISATSKKTRGRSAFSRRCTRGRGGRSRCGWDRSVTANVVTRPRRYSLNDTLYTIRTILQGTLKCHLSTPLLKTNNSSFNGCVIMLLFRKHIKKANPKGVTG